MVPHPLESQNASSVKRRNDNCVSAGSTDVLEVLYVHKTDHEQSHTLKIYAYNMNMIYACSHEIYA